MKVCGKMSRSRRLRVVLPLEEQPLMPIIVAIDRAGFFGRVCCQGGLLCDGKGVLNTVGRWWGRFLL